MEKAVILLVAFSTIVWCSNLSLPLFLTKAQAAAGEGSVVLRVNGMAGKTKLAAGGRYNFEFELRVGATGIAADGANIQIAIPNGFSVPQTASDASAGYVSVSTNRSGAALTAAVDGRNINVSVASVALQNNDMVMIKYGDTNMGANPNASAAATTTMGNYTFTVKTDDTGNGNSLTSISPLPTVQIVAPLLISEVQVNGAGTASNEFVEIYNNSENPFDLAGWDIAYAPANSAGSSTSWTMKAALSSDNHRTIPGFGFFLFAPSGYSPNSVSADISGATTTFGFEAAGGLIALRSPDDTVVDKIGYGTLTTASFAEGGQAATNPLNGSIERKAFGNSTASDMAAGGTYSAKGNSWDSDNNGMDFVYEATSNPQNASSTIEQPSMGGGGGGMGPGIMHMPISTAPTGSSLIISAQMGDPQTDISQLGAEVHYMVGDGTPSNNTSNQYQTVIGSARSNGYFQFTIPAAVIASSTANGLYYYLKVVGNGGTKYMSASPSADGSGLEAQVAQNPFVVNCQNSSGWTKHSISGTVINNSAENVANALILLEGTGYTATTSASGTYTLSNVRDGVYNLIITKSGYYEERMMDLMLSGANLTNVNKTLNPGMGGGATGDNSKPRVIFTGPPDGMMGVPASESNFKIFIGFSKDLDSTTFTNTNAFLTIDGSTPTTSSVVYDNDPSNNQAAGLPPDQYLGIVSAPSGGFTPNKTYYLVLTGSIRDKSGNSLQGNRSEGGHVISFSTAQNFSGGGGGQNWQNFGQGAMMPPFPTGTTPNDGALNIVPNTKVIINFGETLLESSANSTNIKLYKVSYSNGSETLENVSLSSVSLDTSKKIVTLTPSSSLTAGKYRVAVSGAIQSATGVWLGDPNQNQNTASYVFYRSHFEVGAGVAADTAAPTVVATLPANNATGVKVNPGPINIQFSEGMDPASINDLSISLKKGSSDVTGSVSYDPMSKSASFVPSVVLTPSSNYTLTIEGGTSSTTNGVAKDVVGNALAADYVAIFTTSDTSDTARPKIMFANGDDYSVAITFSEPMNSAKVTNSSLWPKSVLNPNNYVLKYGNPGTNFLSAGTVISLANVQFSFEGMSNTVIIENLGVSRESVLNKEYFVDMATSSVSASGAADLSGNPLTPGTSTSRFVMPVKDSSQTKGMLGPNMGGGSMGGSMGPNMGQMGMMKAGAFPMNAMAGQLTTYFVDLPTSNQILNGYKAVLVFPAGFDVSGAKKDPYSPINNDVNRENSGVISFSTAAETSGGANNDGVTVDTDSRQVTVTFAVSGTTPASDFIHFDLAGIRNSSIPRDFNTSGYSTDMKILKSDGSLLVNVSAMPFFINTAGSANLKVSVSGILGADVDGTGDTVSVFLGSPMTGPIDGTISVNTNGYGTTTFSNLPSGQYMLFTEPTITLESNDYAGKPMPEPISLTTGTTTKTISLTRLAAGSGVAAITVDVNGTFGTDDLDVFAGSPSGFRVKTITDAGTNPSPITLYLGDGDWMVGVGPAMPKGPMAGPPPMPDWMPPMPVQLKVSSNGTVTKESSGTADDGTIVFTVGGASKQIVGYVKDDSGSAISDAEVWAYQPGMGGMGAHTKTDTAGSFILKIASNGNYTVGVMKPGLPFVPEKSVVVEENSGAVDGNATADVKSNGSLITASNVFEFKIKKPGRTISGKLTDGTNPVSYAPVWADKTSGQGHADTMTDSSGNYILYVDTGAWNVKAYIPNYGDSETKTVVVSTSDVTQNLSPQSSVSFCNISGTITLGGTVQAFMPLRAVQFGATGMYTGKEYGGSTASDGTYIISVQCNKNYRVDTWTPEYGEIGLNVDEVADSMANVIVGATSVSGKNITVGASSIYPIYLVFTNASSTQEGFLNIDGMDFSGGNPKPNGFRKSIRLSSLTAATSTNKVMLAAGDYFFNLNVPGLGNYGPANAYLHSTKKDIVVTATRTVAFILPNISSAANSVRISGTVTDGADPVSNAWVWIGNPATGYNNGASTDSSGNYSLRVPVASGYKIGADKPGYMSLEPANLNASSTVSGRNFVLTAAAIKISGRLYYDTNTDGDYDSGEEIANGFVRAETTDGASKSRAPADGSGAYELGVVNGSWRIWGVADGYAETRYSSTVTVSGSPVTVNIPLTVDSNWSNKSKMKPMTPASGGSMDDTAQDDNGNKSGTGVKLTVPPNALGSSANAGNVNTSETSAVTKTNSFDPIDDKGVKITATDNSGQAITNLNDYVDIEMVLYKADVEDAITANRMDYNKLKITTNGYWDSTTNDWVSLNTTRTAYYKGVSDTEWTLYVDATASSSFEDFVDGLPGSYTDYKLVYTSKTNHLTVFGIITPTDLTPPAAPAGLAATASNGSVALSWTANSEGDILEYQVFRGTSDSFTCDDSSQINGSAVTSASYTDASPTDNATYSYYYKITAVDTSGNISSCSSAVAASYTYSSGNTPGSGSGRTGISYCGSVVYGNWGTCTNGWKYREVSSRSPYGCTLSAVQENDKKMACIAEPANATTTSEVTKKEVVQEIKETVKEAAGNLAEKITQILSEAGLVINNNVNSLLSSLGIKRDLKKEASSASKYLKALLKDKKLAADKQAALINFIAYGTATTKNLGEGERAGVVDSYKAAYEKLPTTEKEWQDAIKIANGRWPGETNVKAEKWGAEQFKKIYLRAPNMKNSNDSAAVKIIAYGLRPAARNVNSEKAAIKSFKAIYGYAPKTASAWDIVRAIAYSGAKR